MSRGPLRLFRHWSLPRLAGPWALPGDPREFPVFLLLGQSNMAGHGCVRPGDPWQAGDLAPAPGVLVFGGQGTVTSPRPRGWLRWRPAAHPLHLNQGSAGFGLGLPFARQLLEDTHATRVGLVPAAWGGAGIDVLGRGTPLYENAVRRARIAARDGTLAGVLWHQGETDAGGDPLARSHAAKLARLIGHLREDLEAPGLPVVIGDLGHFGDERRKLEAIQRRALVRAGLRQVADDDPHAAFVESEGLAGSDAVHFDRASLIEFGKRYADAFLVAAVSPQAK
jgi:hypothetical protein